MFKAGFVQFTLYCFLGLVTYGIDVGLFIFFLSICNPMPAATLSFILAALFNYFLSFKFIFIAQKTLVFQIALFSFVILVGLGAHLACFYLFSRFTALPITWVKMISIPLGTLWNFWARRTLVFSKEIPHMTKRALDYFNLIKDV